MFTQIICNQEDCQFNQAYKCSNTEVDIKSMVCESYEKEELPDIDRDDAERDIKED